MLGVSQGQRKNREAGKPIYCPISIMNQTETFIRRGQFAIIAGGPGTGKSAITQAILQRGNDKGAVNTTMYFSADSDASTMFKRAAAIATGHDMSYIDSLVREGNAAELYGIVDAKTHHMKFSYASSPDVEDIQREVLAYETAYGAFPEVIVMDNLKNLYAGEGSEFEALEGNCEFLHGLARDTGAAVIALHHVVGASEDGISPIPLSGLRGKVSKTPEMVLTLHRSETHLNISPVKNRSGKAQASGTWFLPVKADLSRMYYEG